MSAVAPGGSSHGKHLRGETPKRVVFADEGITCDVYTRAFDREEKRATYELVVSNSSDRDIACRLCGHDASAHTLVYGVLPIGKHSAGTSLVTVPLESSAEPPLFIRALGDGVDVFAQAQQPRRTSRFPVFLAVLALVGLVAVAAGYAAASLVFGANKPL